MGMLFEELPLTFFTTLGAVGAGGFIAMALAFLSLEFDDAQLRRTGRLTLVPLIVVLVGFVAAFFHLAAPGHAAGVFAGIGPSPLSNEVLVGVIFVVVALIYVIIALVGRASLALHRTLSVIVAVLAIVFAWFMGQAYLVDTIPSWNTMLVPIQMLGYLLLGGASLGMLVLAVAGVGARADAERPARDDVSPLSGEPSELRGRASRAIPLNGGFKASLIVLALLGLVLAIVGFCGQVGLTTTLSGALESGAGLVAGVVPDGVVAVICLVLAAVAVIVGMRGRGVIAWAVAAVVLSVVGIFIARLVFYALRLSIGL